MADFTVEWTDRAYASLRQVHSFIALDSPAGAKKVVREILHLSKKLETMPRRHPLEPNLADAPVEYRFMLKWNWKIIFTIYANQKKVLVVLVFDTRQNPERMRV